MSIRRGRFLWNGVEVAVLRDCVNIVNSGNSFSGFTFNGFGISVGWGKSALPVFQARDVPRYGIDRNGIDRAAQFRKLRDLSADTEGAGSGQSWSKCACDIAECSVASALNCDSRLASVAVGESKRDGETYDAFGARRPTR
jgi:hypothetical protein